MGIIMNILLVDDEAPARQRLRRLLTELPNAATYHVIGELADSRLTFAQCTASPVDVVLLDVRMPGMDGLQVAAQLAQLTPPPAVILITAYSDYALAAFDHHVADYLVKPVRRERLQAALERLHLTTRLQSPSPPFNAPARRTQLQVNYRGSLLTIPIATVIYLQAEQKYVTIHYPGGAALIDESLKHLEIEFADQFIRVHRSILIARAALTGIAKHQNGEAVAVLSGTAERLPISRRHVAAVRQVLRAGMPPA